MYSIMLTQYNGAILGPIAKILGLLMNGIFVILDKIGIPNVGLSIIIFTIVIYLLMTPLTYKQQKFSKLSQRMNPELQAVQAKYKGKKDPDSMNRLNEETRAIYDKYGVSPTGSCLQLAIQMPILFALYRVIYAMPAYVNKIGDSFRVLADKIISVDNGEFLNNTGVDAVNNVIKSYGKSFTEGTDIQNGIVDILNKISSNDLQNISAHYDLSALTFDGQKLISEVGSNGEVIARGLIDKFNYFLGLNIGDSPSQIMSYAIKGGNGIQIGLAIGAILIPLLAAFTQWFNTKLMPQPTNNNNPNDTVSQSMKSMNTMMPIMSAVFCFTLPAGMGIYWIAGAVVRSVQQVVINKMIDRENVEDIIKANADKAKKKAEKRGVQAEKMNNYAKMNTKTASLSNAMNQTKAQKEDAYNKAMEKYASNAKPGSLAAKANMVKTYNEKNNK